MSRLERIVQNSKYKESIMVLLDFIEEKGIPEDMEFLESFCKAFVCKQRENSVRTTEYFMKKYPNEFSKLKNKHKYFRLGKKVYYGKYFYFWTGSRRIWAYGGSQKAGTNYFACKMEGDKIKILNKKPLQYQPKTLKIMQNDAGISHSPQINSLTIKF